MTKKQQRIYAIILVLIGAGVAVALSLIALRDNVTYFYSPSDIFEGANPPPPDTTFRLGGLVADGSVTREGTITSFVVTDTVHSVDVSYEGIVPDLFREGQGVIATGRLDPEGVFVAERLLAKHDENYMPPEVAKALEDVHKNN